MTKRPHLLMNTVLLLVIVLSMPLVAVSASQSTPAASPPANSQESRAIAFYPEETGPGTFVTIEVAPGSQGEFVVILGNSGNVDQSLRTYSTPALSASNGGFTLGERDAETDMPTTWIEYPEQVLDLKPTEGRQVVVKVFVPEDAQPGEYVTALAAEQADPFEVEDSENFNQMVRWSIPVLIVVPGEAVQQFELGDATLEQRGTILIANIEIANTGTAIVRPHGEVRLIGENGDVVGVAEVKMESVYSGTETVIITAWDNPPALASYSLEVSLATEDNSVAVDKSLDNIVPFGEVLAGTPQPGLGIFEAELTPATMDSPPSLLLFNGEISNNGEAIEDARVSIVTYKDGEEVDRYPILQAVTIQTGETPVEARYSLPGGFTTGTYTFEVTIELGDMGTQTVLVTQPLDYELTVP